MLKPTPQFLTYSLSKAGLYWLTTTLAQALAPAHPRQRRGARPDLAQRAPERKPISPASATPRSWAAAPSREDVCAAVRYLLEAPAVTGQMIAVDGGQHLIWQTPDVGVRE